MSEHKKITRELASLEAELIKINRALEAAMSKAEFEAALAEIYVAPGRVYIAPGLGKYHRDVTRQTDEILDRILQLRKKLYGTGEE